eukprot:4884561-Pleurochrysis_carterae.AAC.2
MLHQHTVGEATVLLSATPATRAVGSSTVAAKRSALVVANTAQRQILKRVSLLFEDPCKIVRSRTAAAHWYFTSDEPAESQNTLAMYSFLRLAAGLCTSMVLLPDKSQVCGW